ncbi:unnamed protein product [Urochloa humidicola]
MEALFGWAGIGRDHGLIHGYHPDVYSIPTHHSVRLAHLCFLSRPNTSGNYRPRPVFDPRPNSHGSHPLPCRQRGVGALELRRRGGDGGVIEAVTTATQGSFRRWPSSSPAAFSPITPAPIRVGEDQPPPSWDPIPSPKVDMVGMGSPRLNMLLLRGQKKPSPKAASSQKKPSPKANFSRKKPSPKAGSSKSCTIERTRASWNSVLEKTLVDLLHEHNTPDYRGQNGWTSEA